MNWQQSSTMTFASWASTTCHGSKQKLERLPGGLPEKREKTKIRWLNFGMTELLSDEDEGIAEALRRDAEIEGDPVQAISLSELDSQVQGRRG